MRALPILLLLAACASPDPQGPAPKPLTRSNPFVAPPTTGYPLTAAEPLIERLEGAYEGLRQGLDLAGIEAAGRELLIDDPGFHPAMVLVAQVEFLRQNDAAAITLLQPVVDELPDYTAARLLLGGAAERQGDLPVALESFLRIAGAYASAGRRADEIRPRAVEMVYDRLQDALERGHGERAEEHLLWLDEWAADSWEALDGRRLVAVDRGDLEGELETVRQLAAIAGDLFYRQRAAELELEVGDVRTGLDQLESLRQEYPEHAPLDDLLALAKFLWRLQLLPPEVQEIGEKAELDRADLATLLYWLVPQIRASRVTNPPIAADILDHPRRDEILRVLNLGLMEVDETLHRFEPADAAKRVVVFRALLGLLSSSQQRFACLSGAAESSTVGRSWRAICQQTEHCQLIPEAADCRPAATISGGEVLELFRHTLDLLGSRG
ncbi:MAG: hypothetical protein AAF657_05090 [Acidobacteriota bacterium]